MAKRIDVKKLYIFEVTTEREEQELLEKVHEDRKARGLDKAETVSSFLIMNEGQSDVHVQINGGNYFRLEAGKTLELYRDETHVCSCKVQEVGAEVKFGCLI